MIRGRFLATDGVSGWSRSSDSAASQAPEPRQAHCLEERCACFLARRGFSACTTNKSMLSFLTKHRQQRVNTYQQRQRMSKHIRLPYQTVIKGCVGWYTFRLIPRQRGIWMVPVLIIALCEWLDVRSKNTVSLILVINQSKTHSATPETQGRPHAALAERSTTTRPLQYVRVSSTRL